MSRLNILCGSQKSLVKIIRDFMNDLAEPSRTIDVTSSSHLLIRSRLLLLKSIREYFVYNDQRSYFSLLAYAKLVLASRNKLGFIYIQSNLREFIVNNFYPDTIASTITRFDEQRLDSCIREIEKAIESISVFKSRMPIQEYERISSGFLRSLVEFDRLISSKDSSNQEDSYLVSMESSYVVNNHIHADQEKYLKSNAISTYFKIPFSCSEALADPKDSSSAVLIYYKRPRLSSLVDGTNLYFIEKQSKLYRTSTTTIATIPIFEQTNNNQLKLIQDYWDRETIEINQPCLFVGGDPEYSDWFSYFLPLTEDLFKIIHHDTITIVVTKLKGFMRESLRMIFPKNPILELQEPNDKSFKLFKFKSLLVPETRTTLAAYNFCRTYLFKKSGKKISNSVSRVYLRQKPTNHGYARIHNEEEVCALLTRYNFTQIYPDDFGLAEKSILLNQAQIIFSIYGSTSFNHYLFAPPSCVLIQPIRRRLLESLDDGHDIFRWNKILAGRIIYAEMDDLYEGDYNSLDYNTPGILPIKSCEDYVVCAIALQESLDA